MKIVWFCILVWVASVATFWLASPILLAGLRTGKLLARGRIYDRDNAPGMYWTGIVFWTALLAFSVWLSLFLIWGLTKS
jgi:hypothetical protein